MSLTSPHRKFILNHCPLSPFRSPNWLDNFAMLLHNIRMWIARRYEKTLKVLFNQFPAVVVTGPRQVGKTALVRHVFPSAEYVSLDLPSVAADAENNAERFLRGRREPLIIDEVQYAPSLFRYLKAIIDEDRRPKRFVLTGSQNFLLMQGISESLAGRCAILNMLNLSASEARQTFGKFDEETYLFQGGYPELYANPEIDPHFWYAGYLSTYLERDVRNILNVGSLRDFDRFLRAVASRTGQVLSYSDLARDVGVAPNTAKAWISVLQASGQIFLLEPYYGNIGKRLVKSPKLYMCDTGLAAFLMGFENWEAVARHPVVGAVWETHVVMQVVKHLYASGKALPLWYWRTSQGEEVDLLLQRSGRFIAIECKYAESVDQGSLKGFNAMLRAHGEKSVSASYIAARTPRAYALSSKVTVVPGSLIDTYLK
jgi:predicted AAA+ superfamily ATPase